LLPALSAGRFGSLAERGLSHPWIHPGRGRTGQRPKFSPWTGLPPAVLHTKEASLPGDASFGLVSGDW